MSETESSDSDELDDQRDLEIVGIYFDEVQLLLVDSEYREPLSKIGLAIEDLHKNVNNMRTFRWFVEAYLEQIRILAHIKYVGRKDQRCYKGRAWRACTKSTQS